VLCNKSSASNGAIESAQQPSKHAANTGVPWRAAARANRQSMHRGSHHYTMMDNEHEMIMLMNDNDSNKPMTSMSEFEATNVLTNFINSSKMNANHNTSNANNTNGNNNNNNNLSATLNASNVNMSNKELMQIIQREKESKNELEYVILEVGVSKFAFFSFFFV
jgi:hypothetical protein